MHDPNYPLPTRPLTLAYDARGGFAIAVSPSEYLRRGLFALFALPLLLALLLGLVLLLVGAQGEVDPPVDAFFLAWCALSGLAALWGIALALGSSRWSRRSVLDFDGQRWTVRKNGVEQTLTRFAYVRARRPSRMLKWLALELVPQSGAEPLVVYGSFVPRQRDALLRYATWLASMLRLPLQAEPALADSNGTDERTAAMLCYLPVQGVFVVASLYFLIKGDRRPLVRFCARQSLCQTALSFALLLLFCGGFGVPVALLGDGPLRVVAIVLLAVSLVAFLIWNLWAHIVACSRAYRKIPWVMPWLRPFVTRWVPKP